MRLLDTIQQGYGSFVLRVYAWIFKRKEINLLQLYDTPVMTKYHHIVSALRYAAIEELYGENNFGKALYLKANRMTNPETAFDRFHTLIHSIKTNGYNAKYGIYLDMNNNCFNGTHRLAVCIWLGMTAIPAFMVKRRLRMPDLQRMKAHYQLSEQEYIQLEETYQRMRARLQRADKS